MARPDRDSEEEPEEEPETPIDTDMATLRSRMDELREYADQIQTRYDRLVQDTRTAQARYTQAVIALDTINDLLDNAFLLYMYVVFSALINAREGRRIADNRDINRK